MKRFYTLVSTQKTANGYAIALDGKPVKTPYKNELIAPNEEMGNALVQEWAAQGDEVIPDTMPLTQLLSTQIDRVSSERPAMTVALIKYLDTDLICYYADQPPELVERQREIWSPVQTWFEERFNVQFETTNGLQALSQPAAAHEAVAAYVEALDAAHFTVFQLLTPLSGSIILAVAFVEGEINAEQSFAAIRVEESFKAGVYNEEKYGPDPAEERKDKAARADLDAAQNFLSLIKV